MQKFPANGKNVIIFESIPPLRNKRKGKGLEALGHSSLCQNLKEFLSSIGINNSVTEKKFNELINKTYNDAVNIKTSQPQCEVIHIRKSRELLGTP